MSNKVEIELPENLTIAKIHAFHETLETAVNDAKSDEFVLLSKNVVRTDTSGIQLLHAFVNEAHERRIKVTWDAPSEPLLTAASILGVKGSLGIH